MTGTVFNIQRFSLHDGPGIRTTVFLKGCSLRCFWCHNPEGIRRQRELQVHADRCILCGACVAACPNHAHAIVDGKRLFERGRCTASGACAEACFAGALEMVGTRVTVEEVMDEVRRDLLFYRNSGGGVTLSGGEPLVQAEFSRALLEACRREGIPTAIETSGHAAWEDLASLLPHLDLVMMDIKHMDPQKHRRVTGATNALILANARKLAGTSSPILFRLPVIPTVNDEPGEVRDVARFVAELRDPRARTAGRAGAAEGIGLELLAFHPLAGDKYRSLELENRAGNLQPLGKKRMAELRALAQDVLSSTRLA